MKIQKDKVKDERKERELLFQDYKKLGLKNKRLEDELKGKKGNPSKRIKLTENTQRELEEALKRKEEQRKLTKYWKKQPKSLEARWPRKDKCGRISTRQIQKSSLRDHRVEIQTKS